MDHTSTCRQVKKVFHKYVLYGKNDTQVKQNTQICLRWYVRASVSPANFVWSISQKRSEIQTWNFTGRYISLRIAVHKNHNSCRISFHHQSIIVKYIIIESSFEYRYLVMYIPLLGYHYILILGHHFIYHYWVMHIPLFGHIYTIIGPYFYIPFLGHIYTR